MCSVAILLDHEIVTSSRLLVCHLNEKKMKTFPAYLHGTRFLLILSSLILVEGLVEIGKKFHSW